MTSLHTLQHRAFVRAALSTIAFAACMTALLVTSAPANAQTVTYVNGVQRVSGINNMGASAPAIRYTGIPEVDAFSAEQMRGKNPDEQRVTSTGVRYTRAQFVCFLAEAYKLDLQATPALQTGTLASLLPAAYTDLTQCGLNDAQMIGLWNDYSPDMRFEWRDGSAIMRGMLKAVADKHADARDPKYILTK